MTSVVFENNIRQESVDGSRQASDPEHDGSLPARRRFELIRLARRQGQLSVTKLSSQFGVSPDTIRRDLGFTLAARSGLPNPWGCGSRGESGPERIAVCTADQSSHGRENPHRAVRGGIDPEW